MRRKSTLAMPALAVSIAAFASASQAQEAGRAIDADDEGPHVVEVFLGGTWADDAGSREGAGSAGLSWRYALTARLSTGLLAEYTFDPFDSWVLGVPVVFDLGGGWQTTAMPGVELEGDDHEPLFRIGLGYEIEMDGYSLKPEINADFVDGETATVAGISLGFRF